MFTEFDELDRKDLEKQPILATTLDSFKKKVSKKQVLGLGAIIFFALFLCLFAFSGDNNNYNQTPVISISPQKQKRQILKAFTANYFDLKPKGLKNSTVLRPRKFDEELYWDFFNDVEDFLGFKVENKQAIITFKDLIENAH